MPDLHSLPAGTHPTNAFRNNGPDDLVLERFKLRELAEGWPMYRYGISWFIDEVLTNWSSDAREWENFRSLFHPGAFVYTTWTGRTAIEDFITASQVGMDNGAFIMHRIHGSSVDIGEGGKRAVVKMKATITQRFELPPRNVLVDAESDCRYVDLEGLLSDCIV
jgi:SnoaL-like domain